jgi:hypothetical protein
MRPENVDGIELMPDNAYFALRELQALGFAVVILYPNECGNVDRADIETQAYRAAVDYIDEATRNGWGLVEDNEEET